MPAPYRILGIVGSLRAKSFNLALMQEALRTAPSSLIIEIHDIAGLSFFNQDVEAAGYPAPVAALHAAVAAADAVLIATPEYNFGMPGVLKNALDWMSRPPGKSTCAGKPVALIGAAAGPSGTMRAQIALRSILAGMGMLQLTGADTMVPVAGQAFDSDGHLVDERIRASLAKTLDGLAAWIKRLELKD